MIQIAYFEVSSPNPTFQLNTMFPNSFLQNFHNRAQHYNACCDCSILLMCLWQTPFPNQLINSHPWCSRFDPSKSRKKSVASMRSGIAIFELQMPEVLTGINLWFPESEQPLSAASQQSEMFCGNLARQQSSSELKRSSMALNSLIALTSQILSLA